ncbi:MAG: hypothetical protein ACI319_09185 [Holdemanella porci]
MKNEVDSLIELKKKRRREAWSSLGLFALGVAVLLTWILDMPVFLQLVGYSALSYYFIGIIQNWRENDVLDQKYQVPGTAYVIMSVIAAIVLLTMLYFQFHDYYYTLVIPTICTGGYCTVKAYEAIVQIWQMKTGKDLPLPKFAIQQITIFVIAVIILYGLFAINLWVLCGTVIVLASVYGVLYWKAYYTFKNHYDCNM